METLRERHSGSYAGKRVKVPTPVPGRHQLVLATVSAAAVTIQEDDRLIGLLPAGRNRTRLFVHGDVTIESKEAFTLDWRLARANSSELIDDDPIPEPSPELGILAQLRGEFRRSLGVIREPMDTDVLGLPNSELPDDDEGLFEEEILERAKQLEESSLEESPPGDTSRETPEKPTEPKGSESQTPETKP